MRKEALSGAELILSRVGAIFNQDDQPHLGHVVLDLIKEIYPDLGMVINFHLREHAEFVMHSRKNAGRHFADHRGLAARVMTRREPFRLDECDDHIDIIAEIDSPGCDHPADIFAAPGYLDDQLTTVLIVYSSKPFGRYFDPDLISFLADIVARANKTLAEKRELAHFSTSLTNAYATTLEQRSLQNLGFNRNIHAYFDKFNQSLNLSKSDIANIHTAINTQFVGQITARAEELLPGTSNYRLNTLNNAFVNKITWPKDLDRVPTIIAELQYDFGTHGKSISQVARILRILNLFESSRRTLGTEEALSAIEGDAGEKLDPNLVTRFIETKSYGIINRGSERVQLNFPVKIRLLNNPTDPTYNGNASDLSESGLRVESETLFRLEDIIELTMFLPGQPVRALALITRVDQGENSYIYGLHLLHQSSN